MSFINLNRKIDKKIKNPNSVKKPRNLKKIILITVGVLLVLFVVIYLPLRGVYQSTRKVINSARAVSASAKMENLDGIRSNLTEMRKANDELNMSLNWLVWMRVIPFVGGYYSDIKKFSNASQYELTAAQTIADSLDPYKQELGFTGVPTPGTDRVAQGIKILEKVIPQLDKIQPDLQKAAEQVKDIDTSKYPTNFGKYRLRAQVEAAKNIITGASYAVTNARPALEVAPSALGASSAKNYLIIFQNDKELRPTGGFMTAYAFMKLDKGRLTSSTSDDIYRLDEKLLAVCRNKVCDLAPPLPLIKYLPEADGRPRTAWSMRDSNISPDVPTSMKDFERMYGYLGEGTPFDGIILIDTKVVEELIKITGPVEVFGTKYSAEPDHRCNGCSNVIYELENYAQVIEKGQEDRKAVLGTLMQQILARSLGSSIDKMPQFIDTGVKLANTKDIIFYMHDPKVEKALSELGWTGEVKNTAGDYLYVNNANFAGGKSNLYVTSDVVLDIDTKTSKHKLTLNYKNPFAYTQWLNNMNRNYVRVYVPQGSKLISSKGSDVKVATIEEELGKTVFEAFVQIRPQNSRQLTFEYQLPKDITANPYPILIQKQPGTPDFNYQVKINGQTKSNFKLSTDTELMLKY